MFDVTGAGDTVISVLATALADGRSFEESCYLANVAAGIVSVNWVHQRFLLWN